VDIDHRLDSKQAFPKASNAILNPQPTLLLG